MPAWSWKVGGILGITDNIVIGSGDPIPSDIAKRINKAFGRSALVDDSLINVSVDGHTVYLDGTVGSWYAMQVAEYAAWSAPGANEVIDRMAIVPLGVFRFLLPGIPSMFREPSFVHPMRSWAFGLANAARAIRRSAEPAGQTWTALPRARSGSERLIFTRSFGESARRVQLSEGGRNAPGHIPAAAYVSRI